MRTETLSIVFTDIKGYTAATSNQTHQENARMLGRIERLVAPVVKAYNGRLIKSIGDAYMIVFDSPTEAVRCSTAVQDRLHQHNTNTSADQAIHIRIAMNIGEVRVHRGDVFGEPVNIAARIESVTPADEIYLSEAVYLTMNRSDVPVEHVGEYDLKGIPEPVTVYRVKKFAHLENSEEEGEGTTMAAGLPFGGGQLEHYRKVRWLRRAYMAMWALAVVGLATASYFRYSPSEDYSELVEATKAAVERKAPMDVLAIAGQIPETASQQRLAVRRYRLAAVSQLIESGDIDTAAAEVDRLLTEDNREAQALMLKGILQHKREEDMGEALQYLGDALKLSPALSKDPRVVSAVLEGYGLAKTRERADELVQEYLKEQAIPAMARAISNGFGDRATRRQLATRLESLGAGHEVDWVILAIEDLKATSCKTRKSAINKLLAESDERAVGPLMRLADSKTCASSAARKAADAILK